jgi:DNA-binding transcriptional LysR family regulator
MMVAAWVPVLGLIPNRRRLAGRSMTDEREQRDLPIDGRAVDCSTIPSRNILARIDFLTLRLFVAIIEEESIAKAAERENIATSAVSKRISDLEHALGTSLISRHHKGITSTPAGRSLLIHARIVLRDLAQLELELLDHAAGLRGHIRVFANDSTIFGFLPEELKEFLELYPNVSVEFEAKVSPDILKAVTKGEADIGLFAGDLATHDLTVHPYHRDRLVVVVPEQHPLAQRRALKLNDLLEHALIDQERGSSIELLLSRAAAEIGRSIAGRIRVGSFHSMCRMVEAGLGIGVVPERFAVRIISSSRIKSIVLDEPWASRQHKICTRDPKELPNAAQLLLKHLLGHAGLSAPS